MNPTPDAALLSFCLALTRRHLGFNHTVTAATLYSALIAMPYRGAAPWDEEGKVGMAAEAALIDALTEAVRLVKEITPKGEKPDADAVAVIVGAKLRPVAPADVMGTMTGQVMVDVDPDDIGDAAPESPLDRAEEPGRRAVPHRETPGVPGRFVTTFGGKGDPAPPASFIVLDDTADIGDAANGGDGAWGPGLWRRVGGEARREGRPRTGADEVEPRWSEADRQEWRWGWDAEDARLGAIRQQGANARRDGSGRDECLEPSDPERAAWLSGWDDVDAKQRAGGDVCASVGCTGSPTTSINIYSGLRFCSGTCGPVPPSERDTAALAVVLLLDTDARETHIDQGLTARRRAFARGDAPGAAADAWREGWDAENTRILAAAEDARRALAEDVGPAVTFDVTLAEGEDLDALASLVGVERDAVLPFGDRPAPPAHDNLVATMGLTAATPGEWFGQIKMEVSDEPAPEVPPRDRTLHHLSVNADGSLGLAGSYPKGVIVRPTVTHLTLDDGSDVAVSADPAETLADRLAREADEMGFPRSPVASVSLEQEENALADAVQADPALAMAPSDERDWAMAVESAPAPRFVCGMHGVSRASDHCDACALRLPPVAGPDARHYPAPSKASFDSIFDAASPAHATCAKPYGDGKVCGRDPGHAGAHGKGKKGGES